MKRSRNGDSQERRTKRGWRYALYALLMLVLLGISVALFTTDDRQAVALNMSAQGLEPGWWTEVSTSTIPPETPDSPRIVVASIPSDVLFEEGSAELGVSATRALTELAAELEDAVGPIQVDGHTDQLDDEASNLELGQRRAEAVVSKLIDLGVEAERIATTSYGETQPICEQTNTDGSDNADCRARCRRVVVTYQSVRSDS